MINIAYKPISIQHTEGNYGISPLPPKLASNITVKTLAESRFSVQLPQIRIGPTRPSRDTTLGQSQRQCKTLKRFPTLF